jgi:superfamily II DNA or RNA helicase
MARPSSKATKASTTTTAPPAAAPPAAAAAAADPPPPPPVRLADALDRPPPPKPPGMATHLSRRGYAIDLAPPANAAWVAYLRAVLTVAPERGGGFSPEGAKGSAPFPVYRESSKKLYLPRALGLELLGPPSATAGGTDTLGVGADAPGLATFAGAVRPEQRAPVDAFLAAAADPRRRGGIISLKCGGGKTVTALYIASVLRKKTLVVVHKDFLLHQWRERVAQFLPAARVGVIKAARLDDVDACDIVLASLQSLALKTYDPAVFSPFHLVVCDECHHLSAQVFCRALPKVSAPVMMGLSATLDRKDGLRRVFEWYLGAPVFETAPPALPLRSRGPANLGGARGLAGGAEGGGSSWLAGVPRDIAAAVRVARFPCPSEGGGDGRDGAPKAQPSAYGRERLLWNGRVNYTLMLNDVCGHAPRDTFLLDELQRVLDAEPGRQTLILSDRRAHLVALDAEIRRRGTLGTPGFYVGGMKQAALKASESCDILLGTGAMAQEALDVPTLDTVLFASPMSALEQAIGRVQRQKPADRRFIPLVIDIADGYSLFRGQAKRRMTFYRRHGFAIVGPPPAGASTSATESNCNDGCDAGSDDDTIGGMQQFVAVDDDAADNELANSIES